MVVRWILLGLVGAALIVVGVALGYELVLHVLESIGARLGTHATPAGYHHLAAAIVAMTVMCGLADGTHRRTTGRR